MKSLTLFATFPSLISKLREGKVGERAPTPQMKCGRDMKTCPALPSHQAVLDQRTGTPPFYQSGDARASQPANSLVSIHDAHANAMHVTKLVTLARRMPVDRSYCLSSKPIILLIESVEKEIKFMRVLFVRRAPGGGSVHVCVVFHD